MNVHGLRLVSCGDAARLVAAVPHTAFKVGRVGAVATDGQRIGRRVDGRVALAVGAARRRDRKMVAHR